MRRHAILPVNLCHRLDIARWCTQTSNVRSALIYVGGGVYGGKYSYNTPYCFMCRVGTLLNYLALHKLLHIRNGTCDIQTS